MVDIPVRLLRTKARRDFKLRTGSTTQQLLTVIVGLSAVEGGASAPRSLPASWDPLSKRDAARRARTFSNQAALVWTIESVVGYVGDLRRATPPVLETDLRRALGEIKDKEGRLVRLAAAFACADTPELSLVRAGYVWRNRVTHVGARNTLASDLVADLNRFSTAIHDSYQGMEVAQMIKRIRASEAPRLKEVAAIVRAASALARQLDAGITDHMDHQEYLKAHLSSYLAAAGERGPRMKLAAGLWGGTPLANARSLVSFGVQRGLSRIGDPDANADLARLTPTEAIALLLPSGC